MAHSVDFRKHVLKIKAKEDLTIKETAKKFCIGTSTISRWLGKGEDLSCQKRISKLNLQDVAQDVEKYPDAYQHERAKRLGVGQNSIHHALKKLKITYKKKFQTPQS
jgi:transposase